MKNFEEKKPMIIITLLCCAILFVVLFAIANFGAVFAAFSSLMAVFSPILIGFAIAYMLNPILRLFEFKIFKKIEKKSVLRALSMVATYIVAILIVVALLFLLIPSIIDAVVDLVTNFDTYVATATEFINNLINKFLKNSTNKEYVDRAAINEAVAGFFSASGGVLQTIGTYVVEYGMGLVTGVTNFALGIFISIYVLLSKEKLQAQIRKFGNAVFQDNRNRRISKYINLTHKTFSSYFVGKIIGAVIAFFLMLISMLIFKIPYAPLVATIIGVTDIIPVFGPILGAIPSFLIIFIVDPGKALIFLILLLLVQQLEGNVISPKILGEATGISELSVMIAIIVMGEWFGFIGMIVGVPVFAVGITIVKEFIDTRLRKKGKSTDTADYYLKDSVVDPHDEHIPIGKKIFNSIADMYYKITKKKKKEDAETAGEQGEQQEASAEDEQDEQESFAQPSDDGEQEDETKDGE